MDNPVLKSLRWSLSIGAKFLRIVPGATATVVFATLVSQIAMLLAFFLPLKVVILLGSDRTPRYFPPALADMDRDALVIALSAGAVVAYLLYLLSERVIRLGVNYGARLLVEGGRKLVLFENQDEVATWGYRLYSQALAGGIFAALAIAVLVWLYPPVALVVGLYGMIVAAALFTIAGLGAAARERLTAVLKPALTVLSGIGFLVAFAYVVANFLWWTPPGLVAALIAVLLARQMFTRTAGMVRNLTVLYANRISLNALFFSKQVLLRQYDEEERGIWPLLVPHARAGWLRPALTEILGAEPSGVVTRWHQQDVNNVVALEVRTDEAEESAWIVRLFDENRSALAIHEATLLAAAPSSNFPAPVFLGATRVERFHCHVFEWPHGGRVPSADVRAARQAVLESLLAVEPPATLVRRYGRSKPYLWQRFDVHLFPRLRVAADDVDRRTALDRLEAEWEHVKAALQALPLAIINPDLDAGSLLRTADGRAVASYWGRWSLDPVGAGWPVRRGSLERLTEVLREAAMARRVLAGVLPKHARIAALVSNFETVYLRQQYVAALDLIPRILNEIDGEITSDQGLVANQTNAL